MCSMRAFEPRFRLSFLYVALETASSGCLADARRALLSKPHRSSVAGDGLGAFSLQLASIASNAAPAGADNPDICGTAVRAHRR
jgi:hypothetical protein